MPSDLENSNWNEKVQQSLNYSIKIKEKDY